MTRAAASYRLVYVYSYTLYLRNIKHFRVDIQLDHHKKKLEKRRYQVLSDSDNTSVNSTDAVPNENETDKLNQRTSAVHGETEVLWATKTGSVTEKAESQSKSRVNVAIVEDSMLKSR